jgi:outer membrane protein OmpA-like peptidoglycan-associated protein
MAENDPSTTDKNSSMGMVLFVMAGLVLIAGAVALGWRLSRIKSEQSHTLAVVSPTVTPAPVVAVENAPISKEEREEVLKRIDLMPNVSAESKEKLYAYVDRAHGMKRLLTVSFEAGRTVVPEKEAARIEKASKQAPFSTMAHDPAAVFVVLGFADRHGDEKKSMLVSTERATSVLDFLQKRCAIRNAIQTVPMGSPQLFDPKGGVENRVAEIWAVLP